MSDDAGEAEFNPQYYEDSIAARAQAVAILAMTLSEIDNDEIRKEGLAMMVAVRRSIKTNPQAELTVIHGRNETG